jgi:hypothetical protein
MPFRPHLKVLAEKRQKSVPIKIGTQFCPHLFGGARRDRTADPLLAKQVLSHLSYGPSLVFFDDDFVACLAALLMYFKYTPLLASHAPHPRRKIRREVRASHVRLTWWVWEDSNHRPHPYQGCALTT